MEGVGQLARSDSTGAPSSGAAMHALATELYPITRSITGDGVRRTLGRLQDEIPLRIEEVASGTPALDWTIPDEWNIRDAWITGPDGEPVVALEDSNLHVMSYSEPVRATLSLDQLRAHVFTLPDHPDWIPYRTSYYRRAWGFCMSQRQLDSLQDGDYQVCVDSTLEPGHLTYGECLLEGETEREVLISCHVCHPSLANDNLSGIAVATSLARALAARARRRLSYRFVFVPGTIGAISWLARNQERLDQVDHGLVLTGVGDSGASTYKRSRRGDSDIDRAMAHVLAGSGGPYEIHDFSPYGYDERQYCSPGFDLPVGCLMRSPWGAYPEYHTSADDLELIRPDCLADTLDKCIAAVDILERNGRFLNLKPHGEPQLGKRGLYAAIGGSTAQETTRMAMLWVLNLSDGAHDLLAIADRAGLPFAAVAQAADALLEHDLLRPA